MEAYKSTKSVSALKQIAGGLSGDVTASAEQLEQQKAELQRLKAAVADKAAVLQKLSDEVAAAKQQQQQQQQVRGQAAVVCCMQTQPHVVMCDGIHLICSITYTATGPVVLCLYKPDLLAASVLKWG